VSKKEKKAKKEKVKCPMHPTEVATYEHLFKDVKKFVGMYGCVFCSKIMDDLKHFACIPEIEKLRRLHTQLNHLAEARSYYEWDSSERKTLDKLYNDIESEVKALEKALRLQISEKLVKLTLRFLIKYGKQR